MSFTTDGTYCCIAMEKLRPSSNDIEEATISEKKKKKTTSASAAAIEAEKCTGYLGVDPGVVNYVGACYVPNDDGDVCTTERNFMLKSARFKQEKCRERTIRRRREKIIGRYERDLLADRQRISSEEERKISSKVCAEYEDSKVFSKYRLRHHVRSQAEYGGSKLRAVHWYSKICKRSAEDDLVNEMLRLTTTNSKEKILICFGDGSLSDGVSYGSNAKPAVCSLRRAFHRRRDKCDIVDTDEYETTK